MIILSEEVMDLEQEHTQLNFVEEFEKAAEEDPVFVNQIVMMGFEGLAEKGKPVKRNSTQLYIKYEDACRVLEEVLFSYRHIVGVQSEVNYLQKPEEEGDDDRKNLS
jgi:hypothetical protein